MFMNWNINGISSVAHGHYDLHGGVEWNRSSMTSSFRQKPSIEYQSKSYSFRCTSISFFPFCCVVLPNRANPQIRQRCVNPFPRNLFASKATIAFTPNKRPLSWCWLRPVGFVWSARMHCKSQEEQVPRSATFVSCFILECFSDSYATQKKK